MGQQEILNLFRKNPCKKYILKELSKILNISENSIRRNITILRNGNFINGELKENIKSKFSKQILFVWHKK